MIFQYADDFIIMSYKIDFDLAMKNLRLKTIEFRERCENLNLSFNLSKTNTMYFAKNSINNIEPSIDGVKIQQRPKLKFLSRIVKNALSVKSHFDYIEPDVTKTTTLMKCLTTIRGGLHPKAALNFLKSDLV